MATIEQNSKMMKTEKMNILNSISSSGSYSKNNSFKKKQFIKMKLRKKQPILSYRNRQSQLAGASPNFVTTIDSPQIETPPN